jgi:2-methylisocitrate lyase-like PEP mutase family enzyme
MLAHAGFPAIATTSAGIAFSEGCPDHGFAPLSARLDRKRMIERVGRIAHSLSIPISSDLEGGHGESPEEVAETIREAILAGVVGGNIED